MKYEILHRFNSVSLDYLNTYNLYSDREDKKYVIPYFYLDEILEYCKDQYQILEIQNQRIFDYKTIYYDTADYFTFHEHQRGKASRFKIRQRQYLQTGETYMEIKFSNNKGKTQKFRIDQTGLNESAEFILEKTSINSNNLHKTLETNYKRITLIHNYKKEKITFDISLHISNENKSINFSKIIFAEVKTDNRHDIDFCSIMKHFKIQSGSLSKYCLGITCLNPEIKRNNFKLTLNKILKKEKNANQ